MKKIKVAIWGLGRAGWGMHTHEIDRCPGCYEIAGCYDILPERMAQMQKKYPACKAYSSPEEMLADPEIELVAVAVRSRDHVKFDIQVLEAGKYLIAEKPIAVSYAEAMKLKEVSDRHPGKMFCRQNRRFEACFQQVQEIIREGILGDIYEIKLCRHNYQRRADWQALKSCAGGQLNNWGPHLIDHALQFIHAPLESVWSDLRLIAAMGDAEDHFKAVLRGTNKIVVDIEVSGGVAIPSPVYAVYGTRGTLISQDEKEIQLKYADTEKTEPAEPASDATPPNEGVFGANKPIVWIEETRPVAPESGLAVDDFYKVVYRTLAEGAPYPVKPEEAFEVVRVTEMIRNGHI